MATAGKRDQDLWARRPVLWTFKQDWPLYLALMLLVVVVLFQFNEVLDARDAQRARAALVARCDLAAGGGVDPAFGGQVARPEERWDDRTVAHYAGIVVGGPSAAGFWGTYSSPDRELGEVVFVQVEGRAKPLAVRGRDGALAPVGSELRFCAASDGPGFWWPIVGYAAGRGGGRRYGEPSGPFDTVVWLAELPAGGGLDLEG